MSKGSVFPRILALPHPNQSMTDIQLRVAGENNYNFKACCTE